MEVTGQGEEKQEKENRKEKETGKAAGKGRKKKRNKVIDNIQYKTILNRIFDQGM